MGWADCGSDSRGRPIGYGHEATCDHPGCDAEIHRGLAYACGGMHGEADGSCEGYFCPAHLVCSCPECGPRYGMVCQPCARLIEASCRCDEDDEERDVTFRVVAVDTGVQAQQFATLDACDKFTWTDQAFQALPFDTLSDAEGFARSWIGEAGWRVEPRC